MLLNNVSLKVFVLAVMNRRVQVYKIVPGVNLFLQSQRKRRPAGLIHALQ